MEHEKELLGSEIKRESKVDFKDAIIESKNNQNITVSTKMD
jgi:hypothetical protein